jgi:predicted nucleic acid-binding Zn ribbon protein
MLTNKKSNTIDQSQHRCLSCGTTEDMKDRRYCSLRCRQQLRQKLNTRNGLLQALNTRYATFYFSDTMIIMDVVPHGIKEIFRYTSLRSAGNSPADDFSQMTNVMGNAWWEEENRTAKKYLASRHVLELAQRCAISPLLLRPKLIKVPTIKTRAMNYLKIDKTDIDSDELPKIIKNAYRRQSPVARSQPPVTSFLFR